MGLPTLFSRWLDKLYRHGLEYFGLYYGVYRGTCMDVEDPDEQGKIQVRVPTVSGNETIGTWAWPISPWAGRDSGLFMVPDVGDPVYVVFENGNPNYPMWLGGWWPKPNGENFSEGMEPYTDGVPQKRIFKTKAGHELSFQDDPNNLSCKLIWHDPEEDTYSFFAFTADGSIQMATHKGSFMEMRTADDDELVMIVDKAGNTIVQNADGTKIADPSGNVIELKDGALQIIAPETVVINTPGVNIKTGGVEIGDVATDEALKGTSFMTWWNTTFKIWLDTHTHPTGVGPSGPPTVPHVAPVDQVVLTDKLKMQ